jgi:proteic killer suppression protein
MFAAAVAEDCRCPLKMISVAVSCSCRSGAANERGITLDVINARHYYSSVIRSFKEPEAERIFNREPSRKLPQNIHRSALKKLLVLDAADALDDLRVPPGNRLEKLSGDRKGQNSIRINDQWRVCFRWKNGDALDVEIADYH